MGLLVAVRDETSTERLRGEDSGTEIMVWFLTAGSTQIKDDLNRLGAG